MLRAIKGHSQEQGVSPAGGRCLGSIPTHSGHRVSELILSCLWGLLGLRLVMEGQNWCSVGLESSRGLRSFLGLSLHLDKPGSRTHNVIDFCPFVLQVNSVSPTLWFSPALANPTSSEPSMSQVLCIQPPYPVPLLCFSMLTRHEPSGLIPEGCVYGGVLVFPGMLVAPASALVSRLGLKKCVAGGWLGR